MTSSSPAASAAKLICEPGVDRRRHRGPDRAGAVAYAQSARVAHREQRGADDARPRSVRSWRRRSRSTSRSCPVLSKMSIVVETKTLPVASTVSRLCDLRAGRDGAARRPRGAVGRAIRAAGRRHVTHAGRGDRERGDRRAIRHRERTERLAGVADRAVVRSTVAVTAITAADARAEPDPAARRAREQRGAGDQPNDHAVIVAPIAVARAARRRARCRAPSR